MYPNMSMVAGLSWLTRGRPRRRRREERQLSARSHLRLALALRSGPYGGARDPASSYS
jgi:hypothetical protein